jgi:hypothetical protein
MKRSLAKLASGWACWRRVEARGGAMGLGRGQIICAPVVVGVRLPTFPRFYRSLPPVLHHPPISSRTTRFPSASIPPGARLRPSCRSSTPTLAPPVFSASSFNTRVYTICLDHGGNLKQNSAHSQASSSSLGILQTAPQPSVPLDTPPVYHDEVRP